MGTLFGFTLAGFGGGGGRAARIDWRARFARSGAIGLEAIEVRSQLGVTMVELLDLVLVLLNFRFYLGDIFGGAAGLWR